MDLLGQRMSGVLLHPTSLPGDGPIGTLGEASTAFVDFLAEAGQHLWQMLPLGPTSSDGSPYRALSAFASNPWLLSQKRLVEQGLLKELRPYPFFSSPQKAGFEAAAKRADLIVARAYAELRWLGIEDAIECFAQFKKNNADWLDDYALFVVLRDLNKKRPWVEWADDLSSRQPDAIEQARRVLCDKIDIVAYGQYLFQRQWDALRAYAAGKGVLLVGDIPIYVDYDSADVWANQHLFELDQSGRPTAVAGVPPDYFSKTGQRWGNPLYRWDVMAENDFSWWKRRFARTFQMVDIVRIDHFRGFDAYWRVPADEETAVNGEWIDGPGAALFQEVANELGALPIIAEDLGLITDSVRTLRDDMGFPGMVILQFAFDGDPRHPYLPENYTERVVCYPGTHDNDTTVGWYDKLSADERKHLIDYLGAEPEDPAWALIDLAWRSPANLAVATLQDLLSLGTEARMNTPGVSEGNWTWRYVEDDEHPLDAARLAKLTADTSRATIG